MSFGGPGGGQVVQKPIPPQRGSFPLDHDGECKPLMAAYLRCLRQHRGTNDPECRMLSKSYLKCRMDHNLMAPDEFKNLGYADDNEVGPTTTSPTSSSLGGGIATAASATRATASMTATEAEHVSKSETQR